MMNMKSNDIMRLTIVPMFAALTAVLSQITIPFAPVPFNLALFSVFLSAGVLGAKNSAIGQIIYILLGAIGLPVFASFQGGLQSLVGPTGGYILGYVICAFVTGLLMYNLRDLFIFRVISMIIGLVCCYALGTAWFIFTTKTKIWLALTMCVFPFFIGDILKIIFAAILIPKIRVIAKVGV